MLKSGAGQPPHEIRSWLGVESYVGMVLNAGRANSPDEIGSWLGVESYVGLVLKAMLAWC